MKRAFLESVRGQLNPPHTIRAPDLVDKDVDPMEDDVEEDRNVKAKMGPPSTRITNLNQMHPHERDKRIGRHPDPELHAYLLDGNKIVKRSGTGVVGLFVPEFDAYKRIKSMYDRSKCKTEIYYAKGVSQYSGLTAKQIAQSFLDSAPFGTGMHYVFEQYLNNVTYRSPLDLSKQERTALLHIPDGVSGRHYSEYAGDIQNFIQFEDAITAERWQRYRTEWVIFDEENDFAGTIDAVFWRPNQFTKEPEYMVVDWKKVRADKPSKIKDTFDPPKLYEPFRNLPNSKFSKFQIQLSLYTDVLRRLYGMNVVKVIVVVFLNQKYHVEEVEPLDVSPVYRVMKSLAITEAKFTEFFRQGVCPEADKGLFPPESEPLYWEEMEIRPEIRKMLEEAKQNVIRRPPHVHRLPQLKQRENSRREDCETSSSTSEVSEIEEGLDAMTLEEKLDALPWDGFVFDTETTGFSACPVTHEKHKVIEIVAIHLSSGATFVASCNPGDGYMPLAESTDCHGISPQHLEHMPSIEKVMAEFYIWVQHNTAHGKIPVLFAHNCEFDMSNLFRSLPIPVGKNGSSLNWYFFDTLAAFKEIYEEIKWNSFKTEYQGFPYKKSAYKLVSLMRHFYPEEFSTGTGEFHNAEFDAKCLRRLILDQLLFGNKNKRVPYLTDTERWDKHCKYLHTFKDAKFHTWQMHRVIDVRWFGEWRAGKLNEICNREFNTAGNVWRQFITPVSNFRAAHLMMFGWLRTIRKNMVGGQKEKEETKNVWFSICREIELLCRVELNIFADHIILELLKYVCNTSMTDLVFHTMKENGDRTFFPTLAGRKESYRPFGVGADPNKPFTDEMANAIYTQLGYKSAHDILVHYLYCPNDQEKMQFIYKFSTVHPDIRDHINTMTCEKVFQAIIPRFD